MGQKSRVFKAKNNGHQNFTHSLGIPDAPPPYLGNIPKTYQFLLVLPLLYCTAPPEQQALVISTVVAVVADTLRRDISSLTGSGNIDDNSVG